MYVRMRSFESVCVYECICVYCMCVCVYGCVCVSMYVIRTLHSGFDNVEWMNDKCGYGPGGQTRDGLDGSGR